MVEGLILLAVVILSFQIWQYKKHKHVQLRYDRKYLLPKIHSKTIGDELRGTLLLKSPCKLTYSIEEAGLVQVLEMHGAINFRQGSDGLDEYFSATFEIRQIEGLHPFGQYIGIVWPSTAPSFSDEKGRVQGEFFLSVSAFQFLLDACEARVGVERLGKDDVHGSTVAKEGLLLLDLVGAIAHCKPRTRQQVGRELENALMISSIDRVQSHAGLFFWHLEKKIAATIDKEKKEMLLQILSWGNPSGSQPNVSAQ